MRSVLLALVIIAAAVVGNVNARQEFRTNPAIVSPEDGRQAGEASNKPADVRVTQQIRQELMRDANLSMRAKNLMIIVVDQGVTLKGTVENKMEMERVLKHAYVTAPKHKIYNQISVVK